MAADLFPGRKVRCIKHDWHFAEFGWGEVLPAIGSVYTIRQLCPDALCLAFRFHEIHNPPLPYANGTSECWFKAHCFVPVDDRETDITVFERLLVGAPRQTEPAT